MLFFLFCTSILVRARTTSKQSLAKAFAPERHLTARVFGKHGLGSPIPPVICCVCVCVAYRVVRIAAPTCLLPTSSGLQRRNIKLSGVWYLSPLDGSLCCERDVSL